MIALPVFYTTRIARVCFDAARFCGGGDNVEFERCVLLPST